MWVENISFSDAVNVIHHLDPQQTILIRILDENINFEKVKHSNDFKHIYCFNFADAEPPDEDVISEKQAFEIAEIIKNSFNDRFNIVVHCVAGLCRSGAVAQCAVDYGFQDVGNVKMPNIYVKQMITKHLFHE